MAERLFKRQNQQYYINMQYLAINIEKYPIKFIHAEFTRWQGQSEPPVFARGDAGFAAEGAGEVATVVKSETEGDFADRKRPFLQKLPGLADAQAADVVGHGAARPLAEGDAERGNAHIDGLRQLLERKRAVEVRVDILENPRKRFLVTGGGETKCTLLIHNLSGKKISGRLALEAMAELALEYRPECTIPAGGSLRVPIRVRHRHPDRITDALTVEAEFCGTRYRFGFAAATPWRVYGPYWGNFATVPQVDLETGRTPENINLNMFDLPAGRHRAMFKLARQGEQVKLSIHYKTSFRPGERIDAHLVGLEFLH